MCGIAGLLARGNVAPDRARVDAMTRSLAHRGPDGQGTWLEGPAALGHRRLSIIDIDSGAQPMASASGRCIISYNGELYNYRELRAQLQARGARLRTTSDTEVLLESFERNGPACLDELRGMFAFALWDRSERTLWLARDPLGIKPLYLAELAHEVIFASEIKAILAASPTAPSLDEEAINGYFLRQYIGGGRSVYEGIRSLPPGTVLSLSDGARHERRYWRLEPAVRNAGARDCTGIVAKALDRAVRRHLVADVPVGLFLSGGLDSTCLLGFAARHSERPVSTFSVRFSDASSVDESAYARMAARHFGTEHHEVQMRAEEGLALLPEVIAAMDEPFADYAMLPTYALSRFAAEHVKTVLSGEGADELFGGYGRYRWSALRDACSRPLGVAARPVLPPAPLFDDAERAELLGDAFAPAAGLTAERLMLADLRRFAASGLVNAALHTDLTHWLPDDLLVKIDRFGMLASLEARVPYLDLDVVSLVAQLPGHAKVGPWSTKRLLRSIASKFVPRPIVTRKKRGFTVPVGTWLRGPLARRFREVALDHRDGRLRPDAVETLWKRHEQTGREGLKLWSILIFQWWCAEHL